MNLKSWNELKTWKEKITELIKKNTFKDISFLREDLGRKKWKIENENVKTTWQNRKNKIIERDEEEEEEEIKRKTVLKTF